MSLFSIEDEPYYASAARRRVLQIIFAIVFFILLGRLIQLQYLYKEEYGKKSFENSIRTITKIPLRGIIFDRNKKIIVENRPSYTVVVAPIDFRDSTIGLLSKILKLTEKEISTKINKGKKYSVFFPVRLKRDIDFATLSLFEEYKKELPGIKIQIESKRNYPTIATASHLLGYNKEISERQLKKLGEYYEPGDIVGATGLEEKYENALRGEKGFEFIAQNARGQMIGSFEDALHDVEPKTGSELHLAIDIDVQILAESLFANYRGAMVAIDTRDGGIISIVSKPDFSLTNFSGVTSPEFLRDLIFNEEKPLFNRALQTRYPPGSTFKMILAVAAIEDKIINEDWRIQCKGGYRFGNRTFLDEHVHGSTNLIEAIQRSCNVYFYQLMLKVGLDRWNSYAQKFGFSDSTGVDLFLENPGLIPSTEYYNRVYGKRGWTEGFLLSLGIGQGEVGVSPIQLAQFMAMIANKGFAYEPHVASFAKNPKTNKIDTIKTKKKKIFISEKTWQLVREGMRRAVMEPGGTGRASQVPGIISAGKTGTAQNPHGKSHAWFVGFAPLDEPKIAICVLVENVGYGGAYAAPIAGLVMEKYLYGEIIRYSPNAKLKSIGGN